MKLSIFTLAAAAGLVSSQCISSIPECAQPCLSSAATSAGCVAGDLSCQCSPDKQADIQQAATSCVLDGCGMDVALQQVLPAAEAFCSAINAGQTCSASSTSAVSTTASTASEPTLTSSTSTELTGVTTTMNSTISSSSSSPNTTLSSTTSLVASTTGNATVTATRSSTSSRSSSTSGSSSSSGTATSATSTSVSAAVAAAAAVGPVGSFAMMLLGAWALF